MLLLMMMMLMLVMKMVGIIVEKEYLPDQVFNADDFFPILGENATKDI